MGGRHSKATRNGVPTKVGKKSSSPVEVHECLHQHSNEFNVPEVLEVTENVFLAIGFGLANSMMVVGPEGVSIVDTMESIHAAERVLEAFEPFMQGKPIVSCIYSHNHADHVMGTSVFLQQGTKIWAHELCNYYMERIITKTGETTYRRGMRQFGVFVPDAQFENSGIGPFLDTKSDEATILKFPTHTFQDRETITEGGVHLELIHCPGETNDQICVYLPDYGVLYGADNIYKAFPNIYAIRGTPARDALQWVNSLDKMAKVNADFLVLGHTRPIVGAEKVRDTIEIYRDAIQFVHDQTIRLMNLGLYLDEIVERVRLPDEMHNHEYLQEFYGTVEWTVRAVFTNYLGWFGGDPKMLRPMKIENRAMAFVDLAGGEQKLLQKALDALGESSRCEDLDDKREHAQWALELFDACLALPDDNKSVTKKATKGKIDSLEILGSCQPSATGRNYYLTCAQETSGLRLQPGPKRTAGAIESAKNMHEILDILSVRLDPEACGSTRRFKAVFQFTDTGELVGFEIRRGICLVTNNDNVPSDDQLDLKVHVTTRTWRDIVSKKKNAKLAFAQGEIKFPIGKATKLAMMMSWFTRV